MGGSLVPTARWRTRQTNWASLAYATLNGAIGRCGAEVAWTNLRSEQSSPFHSTSELLIDGYCNAKTTRSNLQSAQVTLFNSASGQLVDCTRRNQS